MRTLSKPLTYWLNLLLILTLLSSLLPPVHLASASAIKGETINGPQPLSHNAAVSATGDAANDVELPLVQGEPETAMQRSSRRTHHTDVSAPASPPQTPASNHPQAGQAAAQPGLLFIENVGQFDQRARFQVRGGPGTLHLAEDALWFTVLEPLAPPAPEPRLDEARGRRLSARSPVSDTRRGVHLKLSFPGANPRPRLEPFNRLDTKVSYLLGNDSTKWRPNVPVWGGVRYVDLYPGVDLELTGEQGQLVQRLVVRDMPATLVPSSGERWGQRVRLRVDGAEDLRVDGDQVRLTTAIGDVAWPLLQPMGSGGAPLNLPAAWPGVNDREITSPFAPATTASLSPPGSPTRASAGLASPLWQGLASPLLQEGSLDLLYATYLEGSSDEVGYDIAVDGEGNAYVTGVTWSADFPYTPGAFDTSYAGLMDTFVVKLNASGTERSYATYLGGSDDDQSYGIAVDGAGNAYVTGWTLSSDLFPSGLPGFKSALGDDFVDGFVIKLNAAGTSLVYATYLGGEDADRAYDIAVDALGNAYVTGETWSTDIFPPGVPGFDTTLDPDPQFPSYTYSDVFVVKVNASGTGLTYGTYLGGGEDVDEGHAIAIDEEGNAYVTGLTWSYETFIPPGVPGFDTTMGDWGDAFVAKLTITGTNLVYASYLGGEETDRGHSIAVDALGQAYVTGYTYSPDIFPGGVPGFDTTVDQYGDAFAVKVDDSGESLIYATYLGGSLEEKGHGIAVDALGQAYVLGETRSLDILPPGVPGFDTTYGGSYRDYFIIEVDASGTSLAYATYLGGSGDEYYYFLGDTAGDIAVDDAGNVYVTGSTDSSDIFPPNTPGADTTYDAVDYEWSGFAAKLGLAYSISGSVLDSGSTPISGTLISLTSGLTDTTPITTFVDATGLYTLSKLISGTYTVIPAKAGYSFSPLSSTVSVPPSVTGLSFTGTLQAVRIEILDAQDNPVTTLGLNADGWPTPNPLKVQVTLHCPAGGPDCIHPLNLIIDSTDNPRFYVYALEEVDKDVGVPDLNCTESITGSDSSYESYEADCPNRKSGEVTVPFAVFAGETKTFLWNIWIQPSEDANLEFAATWGAEIDNQVVQIPQAQIHPVGLFEGFFGNSENFVALLFEPLIDTLEKMGYQRNQTLFVGKYDYIGDIADAAVELSDQLVDWQVVTRQVDWVKKFPDEQEGFFDLMALSQGALVVRTYAQTGSYPVDIHRLLLVGSPNRGAPYIYRAREGLEADAGLWQLGLDHILSLRALTCGYFTVAGPISNPIIYSSTIDRYETLHDPNCGILFLPQILPAPGPNDPAYLFDNNGDYPFSHQANPLLEAQPANPVDDPWWSLTNPNPSTTYLNLNSSANLVLLSDRIGGFDKLYLLYNDAINEAQGYEVHPHTQVAPLWRNGRVIDPLSFTGPSDGSVPFYSAQMADLWPGSHPINLAIPFDDRDEIHANLPVYPESQEKIAQVLTGLTPPFTTPLNAMNNYIQTGELSSGLVGELVGLFITGMSPIELFIIDPSGRQLGYDPVTSQIVDEIPTGVYEHLADGTANLWIFDPLPGDYNFTVLGTGSGDYTILAQFVDSVASVPIFYDQSSTQQGQVQTITLTVPSNSGEVAYPPDVFAGPDVEALAGNPVAFTGTITDINPGDIFSIAWDFGDGNTTANTLTPTHTFVNDGEYIVTLTVTDSVGFAVSDTLKAIVTNTTTSYFQEVGGQVVMEAEHFTQYISRSTHIWITQTILAGHVGASYLGALPDTDLQFATTYTTTSPELRYTLNFTTTGTYYVWSRGYAPNGAGDSVYISLNDQPATILTGFAPREWDWASEGTQGVPVTIEVTEPGLHTLHLWMREDGLRLDRFLLTTDNGYNPIGNGPPESERRGGSG